jgi:menaquinone-dependent protoporphyrinogen oxidase
VKCPSITGPFVDGFTVPRETLPHYRQTSIVPSGQSDWTAVTFAAANGTFVATHQRARGLMIVSCKTISMRHQQERDMKVLLASASRHGSTHEVRDRIGAAMTAAVSGIEISTSVLDDLDDQAGFSDLSKYDAFVLGSAVYYGRWLDPASDFITRTSETLSKKPVWLFSVGPLGEPPKPTPEHAVNVTELMEQTRARDHALFSGVMNRDKLGFAERAMMFAFHTPDGDFRDFAAIDEWGRKVATALVPVSA